MTGHGQTRHVQKSWKICSSTAASLWCLMPKTSWLQQRCIAALILKHAQVSGPLQASIPVYYWDPHLSYIPPFVTPLPFAFVGQHVIVNLQERRAVGNEQRQELIPSLALENPFYCLVSFSQSVKWGLRISFMHHCNTDTCYKMSSTTSANTVISLWDHSNKAE